MTPITCFAELCLLRVSGLEAEKEEEGEWREEQGEMEEKENEKEEEVKEGGGRMVKFPQTSFPLELETGCWTSTGWVQAPKSREVFCWSAPFPHPPGCQTLTPLYKPGLLEAPLQRETEPSRLTHSQMLLDIT